MGLSNRTRDYIRIIKLITEEMKATGKDLTQEIYENQQLLLLTFTNKWKAYTQRKYETAC